MLLETLIAVPLPIRETLTLPTRWLEGLENLLFTGHFDTRLEVPEPSPAGLLAHLYKAVRGLDPGGRCLLDGGGLEVFDQLELEAPLPDLAEFPEGWQQGLADGVLRFTGQTADLEFTLAARYLTRVPAGEPPLRLTLRGAWRGLFPGEGEDPSFEQDILASMGARDGFGRLRALLLAAGEALAEQLSAALREASSGPVETLGRVLVLDPVEGLEGLLRGLSPAARRSLAALGAAFGKLTPPIDEVYRLTPEGQLMVWRGQAAAFHVVPAEEWR